MFVIVPWCNTSHCPCSAAALDDARLWQPLCQSRWGTRTTLTAWMNTGLTCGPSPGITGLDRPGPSCSTALPSPGQAAGARPHSYRWALELSCTHSAQI